MLSWYDVKLLLLRTKSTTVVPLPFWHKLNCFFVLSKKIYKIIYLFIIYVAILIKSKISLSGLNPRDLRGGLLTTIALLSFWHKLNYFFILPKFWNFVYYLCQNFNKIKYFTVRFEPQTLKANTTVLPLPKWIDKFSINDEWKAWVCVHIRCSVFLFFFFFSKFFLIKCVVF